MPGTPATSPRHGVDRFAETDPFQFATDVNKVVDRFDITAARFDSGLASARPAASIAGRWYYATDTKALSRDTGSAWDDPVPSAHAARHQDGGADALTVREAMMATGATGLAKGSFGAYRNAALSLTTNNFVIFDTDSGADAWDVSNWYDTATGRFTPQIAGYYHFDWSLTASAALTADVFMVAQLVKSGSASAVGNSAPNWQRAAATPAAAVGSAPAVANGTTDYFQIRLLHNNGVAIGLAPVMGQTYFRGHLIGRS